MIFRTLFLVPIVGLLSSCGNGHVDAPHVAIITSDGGSRYEYNVANGALITYLRCKDQEKDATCSQEILSECQKGRKLRGRHMGSHRVYWPEWSETPRALQQGEHEWMWMWVIECT